jgi:hypothetical protein
VYANTTNNNQWVVAKLVYSRSTEGDVLRGLSGVPDQVNASDFLVLASDNSTYFITYDCVNDVDFVWLDQRCPVVTD